MGTVCLFLVSFYTEIITQKEKKNAGAVIIKLMSNMDNVNTRRVGKGIRMAL